MEEAGLVPAAVEALGLNANIDDAVLTQQVEDDEAQDGEVGGGVLVGLVGTAR